MTTEVSRQEDFIQGLPRGIGQGKQRIGEKARGQSSSTGVFGGGFQALSHRAGLGQSYISRNHRTCRPQPTAQRTHTAAPHAGLPGAPAGCVSANGGSTWDSWPFQANGPEDAERYFGWDRCTGTSLACMQSSRGKTWEMAFCSSKVQ